ncbi:MAG: type II toxin-antitoxin system PemK/MazF family toxin [Candidatus Margulisbacteria bacterium]|nr:type II toxin-antitoxin system PemK/MazF family toxin [Candidatus Margulisiibacteriota bacterium]
MKRGEIWTLKDSNYASKARPVVIVQASFENDFDSVVLCLLTSFESSNIPTRVKIDPSSENGLKKTSYVMTEKIVTVEKSLLGKLVGSLADKTMHLIAGNLAKVLEIHKNDIIEA